MVKTTAPPKPVTPPAKELFRAREAAARLTVSPRTLYRYVQEGQIRHWRVRGKLRFWARDLDEFLDAGRVDVSHADAS